MSMTIEELELRVIDLERKGDDLERKCDDLKRWKRETINTELRIRQLRETQEKRTRAKNIKK